MLWSAACAIGYFYMVAAWGGYICIYIIICVGGYLIILDIINLLPLYTLVMVIFGKFSHRLYIAYSVVYVLGTLMSMQVFIVEFKPVRTSERILYAIQRVLFLESAIDMPALGVFCLLQVYGFLQFVQNKMSAADYKAFKRLVFFAVFLMAVGVIIASACTFDARFPGF